MSIFAYVALSEIKFIVIGLIVFMYLVHKYDKKIEINENLIEVIDILKSKH